eukprot:SAG31_NODE_2205_length_6195_cov_4.592520_7_plen_86_part_00
MAPSVSNTQLSYHCMCWILLDLGLPALSSNLKSSQMDEVFPCCLDGSPSYIEKIVTCYATALPTTAAAAAAGSTMMALNMLTCIT